MEAALPLSQDRSAPQRFSFLVKLPAAAGLILLADRLFYRADEVGATLGVFALALILAAVALRADLRRRRDALFAAGAAASFGGLLVDDPGPLTLALCWTALGLATLLPRTTGLGNGWHWILRLPANAALLASGPFGDFRRLRRSGRRAGSPRLAPSLPLLAVPVIGSTVFLLLFAIANPLIGEAFGSLDFSGRSPLRLLFWLGILMPIWAILRPRLPFAQIPRRSKTASSPLPGVGTASITLSLILFNAIFAVQNALDLAFLWSGAPLPDGMTLAEYAHRGAYPLVVTALLAALFVLVTLRPGTDMAGSVSVRRLVTVWIGQNVFLVASTMFRTMDYVEAYSLTELRIEALIWMALVAAGLILICARLWLGKSETWLINANLAAAALVLSISAAIDYDRIAAGWNVRHAREVGGRGASLDLCYLNQMGASALLPLIELESRRISPGLRERVSWLRSGIMDRLEARQADWDSWTWRGARRLDFAQKLIAERRLPRLKGSPRQCDGSPLPLVQVASPAPAQQRPPLPALTAAPAR